MMTLETTCWSEQSDRERNIQPTAWFAIRDIAYHWGNGRLTVTDYATNNEAQFTPNVSQGKHLDSDVDGGDLVHYTSSVPTPEDPEYIASFYDQPDVPEELPIVEQDASPVRDGGSVPSSDGHEAAINFIEVDYV